MLYKCHCPYIVLMFKTQFTPNNARTWKKSLRFQERKTANDCLKYIKMGQKSCWKIQNLP